MDPEDEEDGGEEPLQVRESPPSSAASTPRSHSPSSARSACSQPEEGEQEKEKEEQEEEGGAGQGMREEQEEEGGQMKKEEGRRRIGRSGTGRQDGGGWARDPASAEPAAARRTASASDKPVPPPEARAPEPAKAKKPVDPVKAAKKRLRKRQREEAKARKKARKRERKQAKKKRGANEDLEAFLVRTQERLQQGAAEALAEATRAEAAARSAESSDRSDVRTFLSKTRGRVADKGDMKAAAEAASKAARAAVAAAKAASDDLEAFRNQTKARLRQSALDTLGITPAEDADGKGFRRRRIAIVGAGPVGLFAAVLLAEKHRSMEVNVGGCRRLVHRPDAPEVVILEGRPQEGHCARTDIRIALSTSTQNLLKSRTKSNRFHSGMPVAEIEETLLQRWRKLVPNGTLRFGEPCRDPAALAAEGYDCVLWAGGRRSLDDATRRDLGCEVRLSETERVIVFQLAEIGAGADALALDFSTAVQQASKKPSLRVVLRPGVDGVCAGWLWLFGIPGDAVASRGGGKGGPSASFPEALAAALDESSPSAPALMLAAEALQQRLRPLECTARWVEAGFWSSDRTVCELGGAAGVPVVVMGDAACGRPFYTGTTLNYHLKEVAATVDEVSWLHDDRPFGCARFQAHERRYQAEIHRVAQFERRGAPAPPPPPQAAAPQPPRAPQPRAAGGYPLSSSASIAWPKTPPSSLPKVGGANFRLKSLHLPQLEGVRVTSHLPSGEPCSGKKAGAVGRNTDGPLVSGDIAAVAAMVAVA